MDFTSLDNNKMLENIVEFYSQSCSLCSLLLPKLTCYNITYNLYITIYGKNAIIKIKFDSSNIDKEFMHYLMQLLTIGTSCFTNMYELDDKMFKLDALQNCEIDIDECTIKFLAEIPNNESASHNIITSISFFLMSIQCNLELLVESFREKHDAFILAKQNKGFDLYHYKQLDQPIPETHSQSYSQSYNQINRKNKATDQLNFNNKKLKQ